jgi:hypothetical protein
VRLWGILPFEKILFASYGFGQPGEYEEKLKFFADLQTLFER